MMPQPRTTEKTKDVLGQSAAPGPESEPGPSCEKKPGHGRNGASSYTGAQKVTVPHPELHAGDPCPGCEKGKVYPQNEPRMLVRIVGQAPLAATVYELDRLRCNLCGEVFTAPEPEGVGSEKYDETTAAMIALLKYGSGMPFYRLEKLEHLLGIPLPASTQWEIAEEAAEVIKAALEELIRQVGVELLIFGLDFPYNLEENTKIALQMIEEVIPDEAKRALVLGGNLRRELGF